MPPMVALLAICCVVLYLLGRQSSRQDAVSPAVWIPCIWMMILGSRSVAQWLNLAPIMHSTDDLLEGNPVDRMIYLFLIVSGLVVLGRRNISWSEIFRQNRWLVVFYLYCAVSVLWSDFPFVAFKRWVKTLGDPIMVLILLTDPAPIKAVEVLLIRCAYVLVPLSIVLIKYFPSLGRGYSEWTGAAYFTGVTTNKNLLGALCLVFALLMAYRFADSLALGLSRGTRKNALVALAVLGMVVWLFNISDSKTPLIAAIAGGGVIVATGIERVRKRFGVYLVIFLVVATVLELGFNLSERTVSGVGRDMTLTGRTELWEDVLSMQTNTLFGSGYESFWLGARLRNLWSKYAFMPNQAHNGYIELYLNLGLVGLVLWAAVMVSSYSKMRRALRLRSVEGSGLIGAFARFRMGYLFAYLLYNYTEGAFKSLSFLFVVFLIVAIEYRPIPAFEVGAHGWTGAFAGPRPSGGEVEGAGPDNPVDGTSGKPVPQRQPA